MTGETQPEAAALPAWKVILEVVHYRIRLWLVNLAAMLVLIIFWQLPAVIMREFFDLLTGEAEAGLNVWSVIALLFACEMGRVLGIYGLINTNVPFFAHTMTLLGVALRAMGMLVQAAQASAEAAAVGREAGNPHVEAMALCDLASHQYVQGQLYQSAATCQDALYLADEFIERSGQRRAHTR